LLNLIPNLSLSLSLKNTCYQDMDDAIAKLIAEAQEDKERFSEELTGLRKQLAAVQASQMSSKAEFEVTTCIHKI